MVEYRKSGHSVWDVKYHLIWVTKYRYKALRGEIATRTRDLLRQIYQGREVVIVQGAASPDHVHMLVSVPPQPAPATTGRTADSDRRRSGLRHFDTIRQAGIREALLKPVQTQDERSPVTPSPPTNSDQAGNDKSRALPKRSERLVEERVGIAVCAVELLDEMASIVGLYKDRLVSPPQGTNILGDFCGAGCSR